MGLFSSIKKGLSKAWNGVKKTVKKVAEGVKKVAKKVVTATPWGKKVWELGSKAWKGIKKGIGKIASKLGPVGTMALSFVLAPVVGPALGAMWSSFGAGAAAMATSANAFVATLGSVGQGIFASGNFIGGTIGAMGNAISQGASNVMAGNFSGAVSSFASNMSAAFTGNAGMAAVHAGAAQASAAAASNIAAGESLFAAEGAAGAAQVAELQATVASNVNSLNSMGAVGQEALGSLSSEQLTNIQMNNPEAIQTAVDSGINLASPVAPVDPITGQAIQQNPMSVNPTTTDDIFRNQALVDSEVSQFGYSSTALNQQSMVHGNTGVANAATMGGPTAANTQLLEQATAVAVTDPLSEVAKRGGQVADLLGGSGEQGGYQPYVPEAIKSTGMGNTSRAQGQGSAGFSLLGGVQGLEESVRRSQGLMFS